MSRLEVYAFDKETGDSRRYGEASNAFGGAYTIWESLSRKYDVTFSLMSDAIQIWSLADTDKISTNDNTVLKFTFDRVWVRRDNIHRLVTPLRAFCVEFIDGKQIAKTLPALIEILERAAQDEAIEGVSFNQTSVCANPWWVRNEDDEYDDGRPYNLRKDSNHWELFR